MIRSVNRDRSGMNAGEFLGAAKTGQYDGRSTDGQPILSMGADPRPGGERKVLIVRVS